MTSRFFTVSALVAALAFTTVSAGADEAPVAASATAGISDALMQGLGMHAQNLEDMKKRGAFTFSGRMEALDGDGKASDVKEITMRSTPTGPDRLVKVMKYVEDGKDKTVEAQQKADARRAKHKQSKNEKASKELKLPFLPTEQWRYDFSFVERDAANPSRVKIAFSPKVAGDDTIKGTAWVDEKEKQVLTTGFSPSKNPTFVDHVDITIVFDLATPLGRAPSAITFDGRGGFLFVRKHYRGSGTLSDPALANP